LGQRKVKKEGLTLGRKVWDLGERFGSGKFWLSIGIIGLCNLGLGQTRKFSHSLDSFIVVKKGKGRFWVD